MLSILVLTLLLPLNILLRAFACLKGYMSKHLLIQHSESLSVPIYRSLIFEHHLEVYIHFIGIHARKGEDHGEYWPRFEVERAPASQGQIVTSQVAKSRKRNLVE